MRDTRCGSATRGSTRARRHARGRQSRRRLGDRAGAGGRPPTCDTRSPRRGGVRRGAVAAAARRASAARCCSRSPRPSARSAPELAELDTRNMGKPIVEAEFDVGRRRALLRVLRGHGDEDPRRDARGAGQRAVDGRARAGRRRRANHPVELSAADGGVEAGAGAGGRLHGGAQAGRADAAVGAAARRDLRDRSICRRASSTSSRATVRSPARRWSTDPRVDKIAFTGGVDAGRLVIKGAADTIKRMSIELGGKNPNIVFADADFDAAVDGALFGAFANQGEVCSAGSRLLVERSIYDRMLAGAGREDGAHPPRRSAGSRDEDGPARDAASTATRCSATSTIGRREGRLLVGRRHARDVPALAQRLATSSRRSSPTSTTARASRRKRSSARCWSVIPFARRGRGDPDRQRHAVRPGRRRLDARRLPRHPRAEADARRASCG